MHTPHGVSTTSKSGRARRTRQHGRLSLSHSLCVYKVHSHMSHHSHATLSALTVATGITIAAASSTTTQAAVACYRGTRDTRPNCASTSAAAGNRKKCLLGQELPPIGLVPRRSHLTTLFDRALVEARGPDAPLENGLHARTRCSQRLCFHHVRRLPRSPYHANHGIDMVHRVVHVLLEAAQISRRRRSNGGGVKAPLEVRVRHTEPKS